MQQMRNVAPVAQVYLLPCVGDGSPLVGRVLQFHDTYRKAIDIEQHIGSSLMGLSVVGVFHCELVHHSEIVAVRIRKVYQMHGAWFTSASGDANTVHHPAIYLVKCGKV